ncbi:uncharacterized protein LOC142986573 [Anticarsia gemmatalis]|uniref:uncharacterized protein LOC142986573 n=1 Tax=Anticarsia gemmatalis TaxID=129554 RepID=UPI003F7729A7
MTTDEEKCKISKLLQGIEVPEVKLTERCNDIVKEFHKRFDKEVDDEIKQEDVESEAYENPYRVDPRLLEENERKLRELLAESKRTKKQLSENVVSTNQGDPKRPWRTNTNKEKLLRIDGELKRHLEKSSQLIVPLADTDMQNLVKECREEARVAPPVGITRLRDTVDAAKKHLPNFQYRKIENSTAVAIMPEAHDLSPKIVPNDSNK